MWRARQVFFIDEIHRLQPDIEEKKFFMRLAGGFPARYSDRRRPGRAATHSLYAPTLYSRRRHYTTGPIERPRCAAAFGLSFCGSILMTRRLLGTIVERSARLLEVVITHRWPRGENCAPAGRGTPAYRESSFCGEVTRLRPKCARRWPHRSDGYSASSARYAQGRPLRFGTKSTAKIMLTIMEKFGRAAQWDLARLPPRLNEAEPTPSKRFTKPYLMQTRLSGPDTARPQWRRNRAARILWPSARRPETCCFS